MDWLRLLRSLRAASGTGAWAWAPLVLGLLIASGLAPSTAAAQDPLYLVDGETTVRDVSFRFVDRQTFETSRLRQQIATEAPGTLDRLRDWFDFFPGIRSQAYPFDPITLQKDVARLRRFYQQNGFLRPSIDYPASDYDSTANSIHVVFTIEEGEPVIIQDTRFLTGDSTAYAVSQFSGTLREEWIAFRDATSFELGQRYTEFQQGRIEDDVRAWLRDRGFAFADVQSQARVDSSANTADIRFYVDPGPRARVAEIQVEGNASVSAAVVRRELPFREGDWFSASELSQGQQQLFGLNLFRVALADVPTQPRDSTVTVRYRVREAPLRTLSGEVGFGAQTGVTAETSWRHRNFYGDARTLTVGVTAETGIPENPPAFLPTFLAGTNTLERDREFGTSITLQQPYLLTTQLSGTLRPFFRERINNKLLPDSTRFLDLNEREFGLTSTLVYELLPFRTVSLQHAFTRTQQFTSPDPNATNAGSFTATDLFDKSVLSLDATLGRTDDFVNPTRGVLVRPSVSLGGAALQSDVQFLKVGGEVSAYQPLAGGLNLALRASGGYLWPLGTSRDALTVPLSAPLQQLNANVISQNRFSDVFFYAGGNSDVRGWPPEAAGAKTLRPSTVASGGFVYEPIGGQARLGFNVELRLPVPGAGPNVQAAAFFDAAFLTADRLTLTPSPQVTDVLQRPDGTPVVSDTRQWVAGTGAGLRYNTPIGFVRLDLATKLRPDALDLRRPDDVAAALQAGRPVSSVPERFIRRFRLHFGIGRSF